MKSDLEKIVMLVAVGIVIMVIGFYGGRRYESLKKQDMFHTQSSVVVFTDGVGMIESIDPVLVPINGNLRKFVILEVRGEYPQGGDRIPLEARR